MKRNQKSALIRGLLATMAVCSLNACDSVNWPHVYGPNEVPASIANAPRSVESAPPPSADTPYPRLGDVPEKPADFTPPEQINQTKIEMEQDRAAATAIRQQMGNPHPNSTPTQQP